MIDIKACVLPGAKVKFQYYRDGSLWYETVNGDIFPVPIADIGWATFKRNDKAVIFERYMKQWNKEIKNEANN